LSKNWIQETEFRMGQLVRVAALSDLKTDTGYTVDVRGRLVALFLHNGHVFAIDDTCPHMGGPLGEGSVCDGIVTCPWHGWRFRVTDGAWADAPNATKVASYPAQVQGQDVMLEINW
jgi:nitrite reductase (NADH) small subunit/3-phenylpropionate/trans-cinnamate dioxygenase ferredoxin subunit